MKNAIISEAFETDMANIITLLNGANLPTADVLPGNQKFWVMRQSGTITGCVALEEYGEYGLFRSFAIREDLRNKGLGTMLYKKSIEHIKLSGIKVLYLLTTKADKYFGRTGWETISRADVPELIKSSGEFSSICPQSAVCMRLKID
ncbi:MAG: GNAT family N-acetyltransferase [Bacteroidales bacterium]|nr:GNAT family N-acetyltransferase [Bacteroidales bacterium]